MLNLALLTESKLFLEGITLQKPISIEGTASTCILGIATSIA